MIYAILFAVELLWSYFSNSLNVNVLTRRKRYVLLCGTISSAIGWILPYIVYVEMKDWHLMIPAIAGSVMGDLLVASRKLKPKSQKEKKVDEWLFRYDRYIKKGFNRK
jgi:hypothetical protein